MPEQRVQADQPGHHTDDLGRGLGRKIKPVALKLVDYGMQDQRPNRSQRVALQIEAGRRRVLADSGETKVGEEPQPHRRASRNDQPDMLQVEGRPHRTQCT